MEPIAEQNSNPEATSWLKKLSQESWQAELVVSGIAIYGSLQLPDVLHYLSDWGFTYFEEGRTWFIFYLLIYIYLGSVTLILSFFLHFVLRAYWIGMLGLASAFPEGIKEENSSFKPYYMRSVMKQFPGTQEDYIKKLDDICSLIFAGSALIVLVFFSISLMLGVLYILSSWLTNYISDNTHQLILFLFLLLAALLAIASNLHYIKPLAKYKAVQQMHIYGKLIFGYLTMNIFFRPVSRITMIFITNLNYRSYSVIYILVMVVVVFGSMRVLSDSTVIYYQSPDRFYEGYSRADRLYSELYENLRKKDNRRILAPLLECDRTLKEVIAVFVPIFSNEDPHMAKLFGEWQNDPEANNSANNRNR